MLMMTSAQFAKTYLHQEPRWGTCKSQNGLLLVTNTFWCFSILVNFYLQVSFNLNVILYVAKVTSTQDFKISVTNKSSPPKHLHPEDYATKDPTKTTTKGKDIHALQKC